MLTQKEYLFLINLVHSTSISEVAKRAGLSRSTAYTVYTSLLKKAKIVFLVDYAKLGLSPTFIVASPDVQEVPVYTSTVRKGILSYRESVHVISGLVPRKYSQMYLSRIKASYIIKAIQGITVEKYNPQLYTIYVKFPTSREVLFPALEKILSVKYELPKVSNEVPQIDRVDLCLIYIKSRNAFARLLPEYRRIREQDPYLPELTKQALSYHFRNHVLPLWKYNAPIIYRSLTEVPVRVYLIEGRDAPLAAYVLVNFPYMMTAYIGERQAVVSGQPPCHLHYDIARVLSSFDIEVEELLISSIRWGTKVFPPLWHLYSEEVKSWVPPLDVIECKYS